MVALVGAGVAVSVSLQECGMGVNVGYVGMRSAWGDLLLRAGKSSKSAGQEVCASCPAFFCLI